MACGPHLCRPIEFSRYTGCVAPNVTVLISFEMRIVLLLVCVCVVFRLSKVKICFSEIHSLVRL